MTKAVAVVSGGLDSVTMLYQMHQEEGYESIHVVSFDYGQRHEKELDFATRAAIKFKYQHSIIDISSITSLLAPSGSVLVDHNAKVPEGHYAADNMAQTVVPNRNMIMAAIATGVAVADKAQSIWLAVHSGDHYQYPDCRPEFWDAFEVAVKIGNKDFIESAGFAVVTPYIYITKAQIAERAPDVGLKYEDTWSCYKGGKIHCGKCGTCVERLEAIDEAGRTDIDGTEYEDKTYWRQALEEYMS
jgi:7-cyano-7-deazaguanine synthase